ncbi:hypothetical protein F383_20738 [Gossypium arboreum]|uniref:Uncharacterized protein n=1 Tax=Gossypium arboreum TaxID=29729 RepID=A0A0B0NSI6_GOSAR|nr:hypothetical protein F383_20738 [Gossypium arboreum]
MDTAVCHARVRKSRPCHFPRGSIFSVFGPFLALFILLCSPKYKT